MKSEYWIVPAIIIVIFAVLVVEGVWLMPVIFLAGFLTAEFGRIASRIFLK